MDRRLILHTQLLTITLNKNVPIIRRDIAGISQEEQQRYHILKMVTEGKTTLGDARRLRSVSYRHAKRLKKS